MRKLSYFILGIILLLVVIFTVTPVFIGMQTHKQVNREIAAVQQKHPHMTIAVTHYNRHWFSSDASFTITYKLPLLFNGFTDSKPVSLTFNAHIEHGPLVTYSVDGKKYHELAKSVLVLTNPDMQGQIVGVFNWRHDINLLFDVDSFINKSATSSLSLKGLSGYLNYNKSAQTMNYDMTLMHFQHNKLLANNIKDEITNSNSTLKGSLRKISGLWIGNTAMTRESSVIVRNGTSLLNVKDLVAQINSNTIDSRANYQMTVKASDVILAGEKLGALSYNASLNHADAQALSQLTAAINHFYLQDNLSFSNIIDLYTPMFALIKKGMTINIQNFTLNPPDSSPIQLTASIQFTEAPENATILNVLNYMSANVHITLAREFLLQQLTEFYQDTIHKSTQPTTETASQKAQNTLNHWLTHKMVIQKPNDVLETTITLRDGKILVNGNAPNFTLTKTGESMTGDRDSTTTNANSSQQNRL